MHQLSGHRVVQEAVAVSTRLAPYPPPALPRLVAATAYHRVLYLVLQIKWLG